MPPGVLELLTVLIGLVPIAVMVVVVVFALLQLRRPADSNERIAQSVERLLEEREHL